MIIKNIFEKEIDREIRGVIKVDKGTGSNEFEISYRESIEKQELEEYVVTNELQKHFSTFFSNYKKGLIGETERIGVWISGFFGSGKSHFLKTLAYLLENKIVAGKKSIDYFKEGNKIKDSMVIADMELAANTPSDVILFNIDSKSDSTGKHTEEYLVYVFLKVFNEMQGFCGAEPYIADLERRLVDEGKYEQFIEIFEEESGSTWIEERNSPIFVQDEIVSAVTRVGLMSEDAAKNFCEKSTEPYNISIEDFAKKVNAYLKKKGNKHHIVFLVDEIGQYIADNSQLMLNLQTIVEKLGDVCKGKAWVVVTSQQDIDSVSKTIKGVDFSKIQGRFDTRLSLSSANADEVIKKRILSKNDTGKQSLKLLYETKCTAIGNIIDFKDTAEQKLYKNADDFANVYPFVPYQFVLTGNVLTAIRTFSSSGKHMADGERSLLALFKESAMALKNEELGAVVPFCMFYEPIREFIDHSHSIVIKRAMDNEFVNPNHEENCFNVNVLKVLFMIKYVKEIKATVHNITSLMVSKIDEDRFALEKKVEDALRILVKQTYVQKSGDVYVFLTNEEQEINRTVEAQVIDPAEKTHKISEIVFESLYDIKKYRYPAFNGRYSFGFNQFVDDKPYKANQSYPISLKIITPNSDENIDSTALRLLSGRTNSVLVVLPEDRAFVDEITLVLQIEKFLRNDANESVRKYQQIIADKKIELRDHNSNARVYLEEAFKSADIYVNGDLLKTSAKDPVTRINEAVGKLVRTIYHKLSYIDTPMSDSDINNIFSNSTQLTIDGKSDTPNANALSDMRTFIANSSATHTRISLKTIMNHFQGVPYGFIEADVKWLVARLFKDGDIAFWVNNEAVTLINKTSAEIIKMITRKEYLEKLMIEKKEKPGDKQKKSVKEVAKELFGFTLSVDDDDSIMNDFIRNTKKLKTNIEVLLGKYTDNTAYPGKTTLKDGITVLNHVLQTNYTLEFFNTVYNKRDELLDFAEDYAPIKDFFAGEQVNIFDKALKYLRIYERSKTYIVDAEIEAIAEQISKIIKSSSPYGQIFKLPEMLDEFAQKNTALLTKEAKPVSEAIESERKRVFDYLDDKSCKSKLVDKFIRLFDDLRNKARTCNDIANLKNIPLEADALKTRCINEIDTEEAKLTPSHSLVANDDKNSPAQSVPVKQRKTISIKSLSSEISWEIETAEDVEKYISSLKSKLLENIEDNTIIRVEL